jgi:hypothetical protein
LSLDTVVFAPPFPALWLPSGAPVLSRAAQPIDVGYDLRDDFKSSHANLKF